MKKSLIFKILYLFLVLIVIAGASVFATNTYLSARDVSYGSTNVEDALNGLFTLKGNDEKYSTEEKIVGKWINNKPIYRKVITKTINVAADTLKSIDIANMTTDFSNTEEIINISGNICRLENNQQISQVFILNSNHQNSKYYNSCYMSADNTIRIKIYPDSNMTVIIKAVVEYTKTTD